jgi:phospholipase C
MFNRHVMIRIFTLHSLSAVTRAFFERRRNAKMWSRKPSNQNIRRLFCASAVLLALTSVGHALDASQAAALTPIKHLVLIFGENQTFDRYFGTYPNAANLPGEQSWIGIPASAFHARGDTPKVDGLTLRLLHNNPNTTLTEAQANCGPRMASPATWIKLHGGAEGC